MMMEPDLEAAMRILAAGAQNPKPLPEADLVWTRASALAQWKRGEAAAHSVLAAEILCAMVCAAAGVLALFALRPGIAAALAALHGALALLGAVALAATMAVAMVMAGMLLSEK